MAWRGEIFRGSQVKHNITSKLCVLRGGGRKSYIKMFMLLFHVVWWIIRAASFTGTCTLCEMFTAPYPLYNNNNNTCKWTFYINTTTTQRQQRPLRHTRCSKTNPIVMKKNIYITAVMAKIGWNQLLPDAGASLQSVYTNRNQHAGYRTCRPSSFSK